MGIRPVTYIFRFYFRTVFQFAMAYFLGDGVYVGRLILSLQGAMLALESSDPRFFASISSMFKRRKLQTRLCRRLQ